MEIGAAWKSALVVLLLACVGVAADGLLKLASMQPRPVWNRWFALGLTCTAAFAMLWMLLMQQMKLSTAGVAVAVTSALLLVVMGVGFFGEKLDAGETTGVVMAIAAVALLGRLNT